MSWWAHQIAKQTELYRLFHSLYSYLRYFIDFAWTCFFHLNKTKSKFRILTLLLLLLSIYFSFKSNLLNNPVYFVLSDVTFWSDLEINCSYFVKIKRSTRRLQNSIKIQQMDSIDVAISISKKCCSIWLKTCELLHHLSLFNDCSKNYLWLSKEFDSKSYATYIMEWSYQMSDFVVRFFFCQSSLPILT